MALTFSYPSQGGATRTSGHGCTVCVHQSYCPAVYWFKREVQESMTPQNGLKCESWSDNMDDQIREWSADDIAENTRLSVTEGILMEPNRCGITDPVTGNANEPYL